MHTIAVRVVLALSRSAFAQQPPPDASAQPPAAKEAPSPWLLVPVFSSSPKLGTALGGLGAFMHVFDPESRVSLFGLSYQYTSTHSQIASAFARTSFGADHHRIVVIAVLGQIKNDYEDYLGTGQPLKTDDDLKALATRYLFRATGDWFVGAQGSAANYQVLGATAEDNLVLETLGVRGFESAAVGAVLMHDSRDNEDMPTTGWFLNVNNLAYREALGGAESFDAYRVDLRTFWKHGGGHVLAVRQYNWLTSDAPLPRRGRSSFAVTSKVSTSRRTCPRSKSKNACRSTLDGAPRCLAARQQLYGEAPVPLDRSIYPTIGAGVHFVIKPVQRMIVNLEYAQGIGDNRGVYRSLATPGESDNSLT